jgi:hypothetical protein
MKILFIVIITVSFGLVFASCKSSSKPPSFCDTACITDTITYRHEHPLEPFVQVSMKNCEPDTIIWSHSWLPTKRKMGFVDLVGKNVRLNKNYISCYFKDTSYAWLKFNDCNTGRGFLVKLPYAKNDKWSIYTSALNNFDPKYKVEEGLIVYYSDTFIYVQDVATGKIEEMVLNNKPLEKPDYDKPHEIFDSINVSRSRIWINISIDGEKKAKEKKISFL